jgi:hypothetical protein
MSESECEECGPRKHVFKGENTLNNFCEWLFSENIYVSTVLCHNLQENDFYPMFQYLYNPVIHPAIEPNNTKKS